MHKLTINVPEDLVLPVKRLALDNRTNIGRIVTEHFRQIVETGALPQPSRTTDERATYDARPAREAPGGE